MDKQSKNFIYTATGAAFGLGGIMRFPALCLSYGGAFVAAYIAVIVFAGAPLLAAEFALGARSKSLFPLKQICPYGGAVGGLSAINSAAMCACYGAVIAVLAMRSCTFYSQVNYGLTADMPQITPFIAALVFIALAFFVCRNARTRARVARAAVIFQAALFAVLAARGLMYSNCAKVLAEAFSLNAFLLISPQVWLAAVGQALLSLSLAAGVMPAFAAEMPRSLSPVRAAAIVCGANLGGGLLAAVATITLAGGAGCLDGLGGSALQNALSLYPAALSAAFSNAHICGFFGSIFYISLTLTAFVSTLSLVRPAYLWVCRARISARTAAFMLCAALFAVCLPFCLGAPVGAADKICCEVVAPIAAAGEISCFVFHLLTARRRGAKIEVWKILNS